MISSRFFAATFIVVAVGTGCSTMSLSFLPGATPDGESPTSAEVTGKSLWMDGKFDEAVARFERDCQGPTTPETQTKETGRNSGTHPNSASGACDSYLKALLALERFDQALPVAEKMCGDSQTRSSGACSVVAELKTHKKERVDLPLLLKPKCDHGDHRACATLGTYLHRNGFREESEIPLRNGCDGKEYRSCHRLGLLLWQDDRTSESLRVFRENCDAGWKRSCRWLVPLEASANKKTSIRKKESACRSAKEKGACLDAAVLKLANHRNAKAAHAFLKNACEKYDDAESCWEHFLERSELLPAETTKSELGTLCDDGIGHACRNLAEMQLRLGKKKEFSELLKKGCQSDDDLSCTKLRELSSEASRKPSEEEPQAPAVNP